MGCLEGDRPPQEQIEQLQELAQKTPEPSVRPYLEECVCAFAGGAYSAAIVAGWCAVACYLRQLIEAIGYDLGKRYYRDERESRKDKPIPELKEWDGRSLLVACDGMRILPKKLVVELLPFWTERCLYAHPSGNFASSSNAFELVTRAQWLLHRQLIEEKFQDHVTIIECAEDRQFTLNHERARQLAERLDKDHQLEPLARWVLRGRLSQDRIVDNERLMALWEALKPCLSQKSCRRLMADILNPLLQDFLVEKNNPAERLPAIDEIIDVAQMARFVFWSEVDHNQQYVWEYFNQRLEDDAMNRWVAAQLKQYAPPPYREQVEAIWPNV